MEKRWTQEQSEIIRHRGGNLLVSAGAGAGKTAVLVERILGRILEEEHPIRLDELLVVTFTRAAAAEMKERIGIALEEKIRGLTGRAEEESLAKKLMEEYALLPQAEISTIDSFCKSVIMENFQKTDLDPAFRIADEAELELMKIELLEDFLEENFKQAEPSFIRLVEYFERGKQDGKLSELILDLLTMSESFPNKESWFLERILEMDTELFQREQLQDFLAFLLIRIRSVKKMNERALNLIYKEGGPLQYADAILSDRELIDRLLSVKKIEELFPLFRELEFKTLGRGKVKGSDGKALLIDEELQNKVKELRNGYKGILVKKIKERYFFDSKETLSEEEEVIREVLKTLLSLSLKYSKAYSELKKKKNIVDFSDLSHTALHLLIDKKGEPTEIAKEYRKKFAEIMIDEYQDSNLIQDLLLGAISRETIGNPNLFMVGDVKQSIYGFRQAEPKIFLEKYDSYEEAGVYRKISLFKNFRSSRSVIDTVNTIFKKIMRKEVGGLWYDEQAALVAGRLDAFEGMEKNKTEILIYDDNLIGEEEDEDSFLDLTMKEKEAFMIGSRIKELRKEGWKYSDITILLRSMTGWSEEFKTVFSSMGIPATSDTTTGYFKAWEVQVILSLLSIIDNPRQDIPLAAVLLSPIGDFKEEELTRLRLESDEKFGLWEVLLSSECEKVRSFLAFLEKKRREAIYLPVHELLSLVYEETGFYHFVSGMKGGEVRAANLDMLIIKSKDFESTSLFGLTSFVRYIEKLRKYEKDFGEAEVSETTDSVRMMSIHKSKGLEFPVVFISGLTKGFNETDAKKTVVIHKEVGLATDYFNIETREEGRSFLKSLISDKIRLDNLSEEIRILYVALTRAREKLILTGTMKDAVLTFEDIREKKLGLDGEELFSDILDSDNFMDLLLPALLEDEFEFLRPPMIYGVKDIYQKEGEDLSETEAFLKGFYQEVESEFSSLEEREAYHLAEKEFAFSYPHQEAVSIRPSMTVSELKRLHLSEQEGYQEDFLLKRETSRELLGEMKPYEPKFLNEESLETILSPTEKGSLIHKFLSKADFQKRYTKQEIREELNKISEKDAIEDFFVDSLYRFFESPLAKRMMEAENDNKLFREMPFTLGVDRKVGKGEETIVVQGIIDVWFLENGEPVLLDYKTDRVKKEIGEEVLRERYQSQINYYAEAIKKVTGREVKEKWIYSLSLSKMIPIY